MGEHKAARVALAEAERIFAQDAPEGHDHLAFRFSERRLQFYRIGTLIELGEERSTGHSGPSGPYAIDPALILLDQAAHLVRDGKVEEACNLAEQALLQVPPEHRTSIVVNRAQSLLVGGAARRRKTPAVRRLTDLLGERRAGSA